MNVKSATRFFLVLLLLTAAFPVIASAVEISAGDGDINDRFGSSVAIFDNFAVIGASGDGNSTGSAYIFQNNGTGWLQQSKLPGMAVGAVPPDYFSTGDNFGSAVSMSGSYVLVGAPRDDQLLTTTTTLSDIGSAYLFEWNGSGWNFLSRLRASGPEPNNFFGSAVAMSDQYMIVGAYGWKNNTGAAYIYPISSADTMSEMTQSVILSASDSAFYDNFGLSVGISGDFAVIGAPFDDDNVSDPAGRSGSVYVFQRSGASWVQTVKLYADIPESNDTFGEAVAISGTDIIVGASGADIYGEAYIFSLEEGSWTLTNVLSGLTAGFGSSVAISGDFAIVGSDGPSFIYQRSETGWSQIKTLGAGGTNAVGLSGYYAISGYPTTNGSTGVAVVDEVAPAGTLQLPPMIYGLSQQEVQVRVGGNTKTLYFQVYDAETSEADLAVTAAYSGSATGTAVTAGGTGFARSITITSGATIGQGTVTVTVKDGDNMTGTVTFPLNVNDPPSITAIADQSMQERTDPSDPGIGVTFTVGDTSTESAFLVLAYESSNTTLVPGTNITAVRDETNPSNYTLNVVPSLGKSGTTLISIHVTDQDLNTTTESFLLTVNGVPKITGLPATDSKDKVMEDTNYEYFFSVTDAYTPPDVAASLTVDAVSDNLAVAAVAGVTKISTTSWRLTVTVKANQSAATPVGITVTASDGSASSSQVMLLQVGLTTSPTIVFPDEGKTLNLNEGESPLSITFTVSDSDTPLGSLGVGVSMSPDVPAMAGRINVTSTGENTGTGSHDYVLTISAPSVIQHVDTTITLRATDNNSGTPDDYASFRFIFNTAPDINPSPLEPITMMEDEPLPAVVDFTIDDNDETPVGNLVVSVTAVSFPDSAPLVVDSPVAHTCDGAGNCSFQLKPKPNAFGDATIKISVTDEDLVETTSSFRLTVTEVNDPPEILFTTPTPVEIPEDGFLPIPFQVQDVDGNSLYIQVFLGDPDNTASDPNTALITENYQGLDLKGSNGVSDGLDMWVYTISPTEPTEDLTLTVRPNRNANSDLYGPAEITLSVDDRQGEPDSVQTHTFTVNVTPVADPPVITLPTPATVTTPEDTPITVPVLIADPDDEDVTLTAVIPAASAALFESVTFKSSADVTTTVRPPFASNLETLLDIKPALNKFGTATITITATDAGGVSGVSRDLTVNITSVNDLPTLSALQDMTIAEDTQETVTFYVDDVETLKENLTVQAFWGNPETNMTGQGKASIIDGPDAAGKVILELTPPLNQFGYADIKVTVQDSDMTATDPVPTGTFRLTVTPVNDDPVITNLPQLPVTTVEDTPVTVTFNVSDVETPYASLDVSAAWQSTLPPEMTPGTWTLSTPDATGKVTMTITPAADVSGEAQITITVKDVPPAGEAPKIDQENFILVITPVNDPPNILPDADQTVTMKEDTPVSLDFTVTDPDTPGSNIEVKVMENTNVELFPNPTVTCVPDAFDPYFSRCKLDLNPALNQFGTGTITIRSNDFATTNSTDTLTFEVTVEPVNDNPTFELIDVLVLPVAIVEDKTRRVYYRVDDPDGDTLTVDTAWVWTDPVHTERGTIVKGQDAKGDYLDITPPLNLTGMARVNLSVSDGTTTIRPFFDVEVTEVNDPPTISILDKETLETSLVEDDTFSFFFTIGDVETSVGDLKVTQNVYWDGTLLTGNFFQILGIDATREMIFTPPADRFGIANITIMVTDIHGAYDSDTIQVIYAPFDDPPTITMLSPINGRVTMTEDQPTPGTATFEVRDVDTEINNLVIKAESDNETLITDPFTQLYFDSQTTRTRTLTIDPPENAAGNATITVTVSQKTDPAKSATVTFELVVTPVNDPPSITPVMLNSRQVTLIETNEDADPPVGSNGELTFTVSDPDTDLDDLLLNYTWENAGFANPVNGRVLFGGTGASRTLTLIPEKDDNGRAVITLMVKDGIGEPYVSGTPFTFDVKPVNDAPVINLPIPGNPKTVYTQLPDSVTVEFEVSDPDHFLNEITVNASAANPALIKSISCSPLTTTKANLNYSCTITPIASAVPYGETAETQITINAVDAAGKATEETNSFNLFISTNAVIPVIGPLPETKQISEDPVNPVTIDFWVWDEGSASLSELKVEATASDNSVIPLANLTLSPIEGATYQYGMNNYRLSFTPAKDVPHSETMDDSKITVRVTNNQGGSTSKEFTVEVLQVNDAPTISEIPNLFLHRNQAKSIDFYVNDQETDAANLTVVPSSSNAGVIPNDLNNNLIITATGSERSLQIVPATDISGNTTITLTVTDQPVGDEAKSATTTFTVTVGELAPGDIDGDGELGLGDVIAALQVVAGIVPFNANVEAEPSGNGKIDMVDALMLLQHVAGLRTIQ